MLSGHVQHPCDLAQDGFAIVPVLVALHHDDPVGFVNREIEPSELLRTSAAKLDHCFAVRGIARRLEEFEEPLLLPFLPLHAPLRVVSFEVSLQVTGLDESGLAVLGSAGMWAIVVVGHLVILQTRRLDECLPTIRDCAFEPPVAGVNPLMF
jgi:hypothetical protein